MKNALIIFAFFLLGYSIESKAQLVALAAQQTSVCVNEQAEIRFYLQGQEPYTLTYRVNSTTFTETISNAQLVTNYYPVFKTLTTYTTVTLVSMVDGAGKRATVYGSSTVNINVATPNLSVYSFNSGVSCSGQTVVFQLRQNGCSNVFWESSTDNGANYTRYTSGFTLTSLAQTFTNTTTDTKVYLIRAGVTIGGTSTYSPVYTHYVYPELVPGAIISEVPPTVCLGTPITLTATKPITPSTLYWQEDAGYGWSDIYSGTTTYTFTPGMRVGVSPNTTIKYRLAYRYPNTNCTPVYSPEYQITILPPVPNVQLEQYTNLAVCAGTPFTLPTLRSQDANVQWQISEDRTTFTDISGQTSPSFTHTLDNTTGAIKTFYIRAKLYRNATCLPYYTNYATINVGPQPSLGDIILSTPNVCETQQVLLGISSYQGTVLTWNKVANDGSYYSVANNVLQYKTQQNYVNNPTEQVKYRVIASSSGCPSVSKDIDLTVYKSIYYVQPTQEMYSNLKTCSGGVLTLAVQSPTYGSVQWAEMTAPNTFQNIVGATQTSFITPPQVNTTDNPLLKSYYVYGVNGPCANPASATPISFTIYPTVTSGVLSAKPTDYCYTTPTNIKLNDAQGTKYEWFISTDNVTFVKNNNSSTTNLTIPYEYLGNLSSKTYYVKALVSNEGCSGVYTTPLAVTSYNKTDNLYLSYPLVRDYCSNTGNQTVRITNGIFYGTLQWQLSTDGINYTDLPDATNKMEIPLPLWQNDGSTKTTYYVRPVLTSPACGLIPSPVYTINVHPNSSVATLTASTNEFCTGTSVQFLLPGAANFTVYNQNNQYIAYGTNGVANYTPNNWFTGASQQNTYYASFNANAYCPTQRSNQVVINTFNATSTNGTVLRGPSCSIVKSGETFTMSLSSQPIANKFYWEVKKPGSTVFELYKETTTYQLVSNPMLYDSQTNNEYEFRLTIKNGSCSSITYTTTYKVKVVPNEQEAVIVKPDYICATAPTLTFQVKDYGQSSVRLTDLSGTLLSVLPVKANGYFTFTLTATGAMNHFIQNTFSDTYCNVIVKQPLSIPYFTGAPTTASINGPSELCMDYANVEYTIRDLQNGETTFWSFSPSYAIYSRPSGSKINIFPISGYTGIVVMRCTITNLCGVSTSEEKQILIKPLPQVDYVSFPEQICLNSAPVTIVPTPVGGILKQSNVIVGDKFYPTQLGLNIVEYSYTSPTTGCSKEISRGIMVQPLPTTNAGNDTVICFGQPITFQATGADNYTWSSGLLQGQVFSPSVTTTYHVTGSNQYGCTTTDERTITVNPLPILSLPDVASVYCYNQVPASLSGVPSGGVFSGSRVQNNTLLLNQAGNFNVIYQYTDSQTGCSNTQTKAVNVQALVSPPLPCASDQGWCSPARVDLCFFQEDLRTVGYEWYTVNPITHQFDLLPNNTGKQSPYTAASTTYYLKAKTAAGCTSSLFPTYVHIGKPNIAPITLSAPGSIVLSQYLDGPYNASNVTFVEGFKGAQINPYLPYQVTASKTILAFSTFSKIDGTLCTSEAVQVPITVGSPQFRVITLDENNAVTYSVYPNPTEGRLTLSGLASGQSYQLLIRDLKNNVVLEKNITPETTEIELYTEALPAGLYFLQVSGNGGTSYIKFIKQ